MSFLSLNLPSFHLLIHGFDFTSRVGKHKAKTNSPKKKSADPALPVHTFLIQDVSANYAGALPVAAPTSISFKSKRSSHFASEKRQCFRYGKSCFDKCCPSVILSVLACSSGASSSSIGSIQWSSKSADAW